MLAGKPLAGCGAKMIRIARQRLLRNRQQEPATIASHEAYGRPLVPAFVAKSGLKLDDAAEQLFSVG